MHMLECSFPFLSFTFVCWSFSTSPALTPELTVSSCSHPAAGGNVVHCSSTGLSSTVNRLWKNNKMGVETNESQVVCLCWVETHAGDLWSAANKPGSCSIVLSNLPCGSTGLSCALHIYENQKGREGKITSSLVGAIKALLSSVLGPAALTPSASCLSFQHYWPRTGKLPPACQLQSTTSLSLV